jgi:hypothetical protein
MLRPELVRADRFSGYFSKQEVAEEAHGSSFLDHEYPTEHPRPLSREGPGGLRPDESSPGLRRFV